MGRVRISTARYLAGHPTDYVDPLNAISATIGRMLADYHLAGGDLGELQVTVTSDNRGTAIRVDGHS